MACRIAVFVVLLTFVSAPLLAADLDFDLLNAATPIGETAGDPIPTEDTVLLLQFWASWCHSCGSLMWDMDEIVTNNDNVHYVAVSLDDQADDARQYIRKHKLYDKYQSRYFVDADKSLSESLAIDTVPSILVVTNSGEVVVHKSGHLNSTDLKDIVTAIRDRQ